MNLITSSSLAYLLFAVVIPSIVVLGATNYVNENIRELSGETVFTALFGSWIIMFAVLFYFDRR